MSPSTTHRIRLTAASLAVLVLGACGGGPNPNAPDPQSLPEAQVEDYAPTSASPTAAAEETTSAAPSGSATGTPSAGATTAPPAGDDEPVPNSPTASPKPTKSATASKPPVRAAGPVVNDDCRQPASQIGTDGVAVQGQKPPSFTATTVDCKRMVFREFTADRPVLVNFYASWCEPCKKEAPDLQDLYEEWNPKNGFIIVGVHTSDPSGSPSLFYKNWKWTFPSVWDDNEALQKSWDKKAAAAGTLPISFFLHSDGTVSEMVIGTMSRSKMQSSVEKLH